MLRLRFSVKKTAIYFLIFYKGYEGVLLGSQYPEILPKLKDLDTPKTYSRDVPDVDYNQPVFITHLNNLELREGEQAHFECQVEPAKDPNLKIEFFSNGKPLLLGIFPN